VSIAVSSAVTSASWVAASGTRSQRRRHEAGPKFHDHLLGDFGVLRGVRNVEGRERQRIELARVVVARHAVAFDDRVQVLRWVPRGILRASEQPACANEREWFAGELFCARPITCADAHRVTQTAAQKNTRRALFIQSLPRKFYT
jgi:hypothetical protein